MSIYTVTNKILLLVDNIFSEMIDIRSGLILMYFGIYEYK